jgi:hypothetical protein
LVFIDDEHITRTTADGSYTLRLFASISPATRCLRFVVRPTSLVAPDSLVIAGVQGRFSVGGPPDTLTLNFSIP